MYVLSGGDVLILSYLNFELIFRGRGFEPTRSCGAGRNFEQNSGQGKAMMHAGGLRMQIYFRRH